jgi:hypothetical protein
MALIGVRAVLGVENVKGSPFNVQRSVYIPNFTHDEVVYLFNEYQQESRQSIEAQVVENIWSEFQGQPGLTCWFGELLTERYNQVTEQPITMAHFKEVYAAALDLLPSVHPETLPKLKLWTPRCPFFGVQSFSFGIFKAVSGWTLPNNNILNIISKAKQEPYKPFVLELFQTRTKIKFTYDDQIVNFLYMNGVVSVDQVSLSENYVKFPSPYIQKQLFNYFARELFHEMDGLYDPFDDLSDTITDKSINIPQLLLRYEQYLQANRERVLKNAPRREDLRVYEAVFHFHFYLYLVSFLRSFEAEVYPEFPTGNGQIDLLIRYAGQLFGLELKSFADIRQYRKALIQVAKYGKKLGVLEIWLVLFIETVDEKNRQQFEADYTDNKTGVIVHPVFVQTGKA